MHGYREDNNEATVQPGADLAIGEPQVSVLAIRSDRPPTSSAPPRYPIPVVFPSAVATVICAWAARPQAALAHSSDLRPGRMCRSRSPAGPQVGAYPVAGQVNSEDLMVDPDEGNNEAQEMVPVAGHRPILPYIGRDGGG